MSATLLADLESAGVTLTRNGGRLHYLTLPGVSLEPFRELIVANKPSLVRELLQREIVAAASVDPVAFDRPHYDELWQRWHALHESENTR